MTSVSLSATSAFCLPALTTNPDTFINPAQVIVCSACSGHGFKFCSVVGEITAGLALQGQTEHPIDLLRFDPARPGMAEVLQRMQSSVSPKL